MLRVGLLTCFCPSLAAQIRCVVTALSLLAVLMPGISYAEEATALDYYQEGQAAWRQGLTGSAERAYHRSLKVDPEFLPSHKALASLYIAQSRPKSGLKFIAKALKRHPSDGGLWIRKGMLEKQLGHIEEATDAFRRAVEVSPSDPAVLAAAAGHFNSIGDVAMAEGLSQARDDLKSQHKEVKP